MQTPTRRHFARQGSFPPGTQLGVELTLLGVLGEGGTGVVYRAKHAVLKREVAVKMCHNAGLASRELRERLLQEAKMCASVRDPHVPRMYALDRLPDGTPYVIMEKVEGQPLAALLAHGRLHPRLACELGGELLRALEAVHRARVIHRDVKPSNLIINLNVQRGPRLRLLDFGIGKIISDSRRGDPGLTRPGTLLGTPTYMAPEQMTEGAIDPRVDLYAAGVVLYEMLSGRPPFRAPSIAETFAAVLHDDAPRLEPLCPGLPKELTELVHKAISRRPAERFSTAAEMRCALEALTVALPKADGRQLVYHPQTDEHSPTLIWNRKTSSEESRDWVRGARPLPASLARTLRVARRLDRSASGLLRPHHPIGFLAPRPARPIASRPGWHMLAANS